MQELYRNAHSTSFIQPYRRLYQAYIFQQFADLVSDDKHGDAEPNRQKAALFFSKKDNWFYFVCDAAGICENQVLRAYERIVRQSNHSTRGTKKKFSE